MSLEDAPVPSRLDWSKETALIGDTRRVTPLAGVALGMGAWRGAGLTTDAGFVRSEPFPPLEGTALICRRASASRDPLE
eukprot:5812554-Amphidinium_carterae.1